MLHLGKHFRNKYLFGSSRCGIWDGGVYVAFPPHPTGYRFYPLAGNKRPPHAPTCSGQETVVGRKKEGADPTSTP